MREGPWSSDVQHGKHFRAMPGVEALFTGPTTRCSGENGTMARRNDAGQLLPHATDDKTTMIGERRMEGTGTVAMQGMPRERGNPRVP